MGKLVYLWMAVKTMLCNCNSDHKINHFEKTKSEYQVEKIGTMPKAVPESSGLARTKNTDTFWTHNDSGGKNELYEVAHSGTLRTVLQIPTSVNIDWEELADDPNGNIYIGDFGNNRNARKDLAIYKVNKSAEQVEKITFRYKDQTAFPPTLDLNFDCEAFFYHKDSLYLFTKNYNKTDQVVKLYKLPAKAGDYTIAPEDSISINAQVTAADISPDGSKFALLTYGKILIFNIKNQKINFDYPTECFRFVRKQTEAIMFLNNHDLLVTNEQGGIYKIIRR